VVCGRLDERPGQDGSLAATGENGEDEFAA